MYSTRSVSRVQYARLNHKYLSQANYGFNSDKYTVPF